MYHMDPEDLKNITIIKLSTKYDCIFMGYTVLGNENLLGSPLQIDLIPGGIKNKSIMKYAMNLSEFRKG